MCSCIFNSFSESFFKLKKHLISICSLCGALVKQGVWNNEALTFFFWVRKISISHFWVRNKWFPVFDERSYSSLGLSLKVLQSMWCRFPFGCTESAISLTFFSAIRRSSWSCDCLPAHTEQLFLSTYLTMTRADWQTLFPCLDNGLLGWNALACFY